MIFLDELIHFMINTVKHNNHVNMLHLDIISQS